MPENVELCPVLEIFVYKTEGVMVYGEGLGKGKGGEELIGVSFVSLKSALGFYFDKEKQGDYEKKWKEMFSAEDAATTEN